VAYRPLQAAVRACARAADRVIATDQTLLPTVLAHLGTDPARVRVVPNAIDVEDIDRLADAGRAAAHRRALGLEPDDVLIVSVGRLEENKGFATLIEALASLHAGPAPLGERWKLVLVGDGPFRGALERQVAAAGLQDRVRMPGRVSDADLQAWYDAATLFVHPTLYEGSSLVTLEAMAHRRAVVATQSGGLPDKVRPGVNGWLVAPGDAGALASALRDALSDRSRLGFMGLASRAIVCREFDWSVVTGRFLSVCDEVIRGRSSDA
jgi:glycosyltransferase involved in cell wall biosynthesis